MYSLWLVASVLLFLNGARSYPPNPKDGLFVAHKWKTMEFDYPNTKAKNEALQKGSYIPKNSIPLDADYHPGTDRFFVAMPPFRNGTPASLGEVTRGSSLVKPFPKWPNFNDPNICQKGAPFSVYRIFIDKCGLLWVPDTGINESLYSSKLNCPLKLVVYDLNNKDQEVLRYEFPKGVVTDRSLIVNVFTESYRSDCSDTIAYIADIMDYAMIVFDYAKKTSWRITQKYFRMFPTSPTMIMSNGVALDLNDGLCGLALSPASDRERKLYFHAFSSLHENWVPVSVLKNTTAVQDPLVLRNAFSISPGMRQGQSTVQVMTDDGILIYPVLPNNTLECWNYRTPFVKENLHVLKRDDENFQFVSGLKLIGNRLLVTASRFHNYLLANLSDTDYNFRLTMIEDVRQLLRGTPCASSVPLRPDSSGPSVREPAHSANSNSNTNTNTNTNANGGGGGLCYGSVPCENRPTSSSAPSVREPSSNWPPPPPPPGPNGVIFKPHSNKKTNNYDSVHNRLGGSDDGTNSTTASPAVAAQEKTSTGKKVATGPTRKSEKTKRSSPVHERVSPESK